MTHEIYCEIFGKSVGIFKSKIKIEIDFGQKNGSHGAGNPLLDGSGGYIEFNSMVHALNHLGENGWLLVNAHTIANEDEILHYYVMRKIVY